VSAAAVIVAALLLAQMESATLDQIDRAQELDQLHIDVALAAHQNRPRPPRQPPSGFCRCCGEEIPAPRRRALPEVRTCVECQAEIEGASR